MKLYEKISKLPVNEKAIIRPRIDALLEEGMQFPAVVVSAGAGFGKTQAVASFLERSEYHAVWQQLTLLDNLPMRFWESFVHTVSLHRPAMAEKIGKLEFPDSLYNFYKFLQIFTEELYEDDKFVVFVFDDFHLIQDQSVLEFFKFFLSANLENICIVFLTRKLELEFPHGRVYLLPMEELQFTKEETKQYFKQQSKNIPNKAEIDDIYLYTKGWPLALNLIALQRAQKRSNEKGSSVDSQQVIFKLIETEIFSQYSAKERQFLVLLSTLNFFPQELLIEISDCVGEGVFSSLQNNMFVSYDYRAKNYYLHQFFLDFLIEKQYLVKLSLKQVALEKAGDWCRAADYFVDAINYYERCNKTDKVLQVILGFEGRRHSRDTANFLIHYIEKFSDEFMRQHIMCRIVYAMLFLNNLEIRKARKQMEIVHAQLKQQEATPEMELLLGEALVGKGLIEMGMNSIDFVDWFRKADEYLPNGSDHWDKKLKLLECSNALNIASAEAGAVEERIESLYEGAPYIAKVLNGAGYGVEFLASAESYFLRGDFQEAQKDAYKAMYKAKEMNQQDVIDNALFLLLRIFLATGAIPKINETLERLQKNEQNGDVSMQYVPGVALGWFYSEIGEVNQVAEWLIHGEENRQPPISIDKDVLLQIRCLIERKDYPEALALTMRLETILQKRNMVISLIYVYVYRAIIYYVSGNLEQTAQALGEAYTLAHPNGMIMPFIEFGHKTRSMLLHFRKQGHDKIPGEWLALVHAKATTYAKRHTYILSRFKDSEKKSSADYGLTYREIELLRNVSQGLTRDEIASSMYISPHTVKNMLKTIYNKMGAVNGADAVRIAGNSQLI